MYTLEDIQAVDMEVAQAITDELDRQNSHIELIASENWVSPAVMSAMGSVLTNKYAPVINLPCKMKFHHLLHRIPVIFPEFPRFRGFCFQKKI